MMSTRILLLSGYACTSDIWKSVTALLPQDHRLTLVDWPTDLTPGFLRVEDFSHWLAQNYPPAEFDIWVGHSLGGLAASHMLAQQPALRKKLILVESFVQPPGPFFQNLVMPDTDPHIRQTITEMLQTQRACYSTSLQQSLRSLDISDLVSSLPSQVYAMYGDRGQPTGEGIRALDWPPALKDHVQVSFIPHACHFPMVENPEMLAKALMNVLGSGY